MHHSGRTLRNFRFGCKPAEALVLSAQRKSGALVVIKLIEAEVLRAHFDEGCYKLRLRLVGQLCELI
jgi:hypothetical protein